MPMRPRVISEHRLHERSRRSARGHVLAAAHHVGHVHQRLARAAGRADGCARNRRPRSRARRAAPPRARRRARAPRWCSRSARGCAGRLPAPRAASRCTSASRASVGVGLAGERDQLRAAALHQRHDLQQLLARAGVGDRDEHVAGLDHAEVAVARLGGVHEVRRRAGARERRGDLARDVARLAHAAHHHAPLALEDQRRPRRGSARSMRSISARTASASMSSTRRASSSAELRSRCSARCGRCPYHARGV